MAMARDVGARVGSGLLAAQAGPYYFGSTSPDIRVLTRWERERTHFFDLGSHEHQDSVAAMFAEHPQLADAGRLSPETAAFVAGYIGHLALDQTWIEEVYRPHFGQLSALGGDAQANIMDRLLQFELERRRREEPETVAGVRAALECCSLAIDVGFLDSDTLRRWLDVAIDQTRHPPSWDRFRQVASRHLRGAGIDTEEALAEFMARVPDVLERTMRHVSTTHVDAYLEQSTDKATRIAEKYLGGR
jgi:hypothetical protein